MTETTKPVAALTDKMKEIIDRTGYPHEITAGQRKYGPPTDWSGPQPGAGREIYCGKIPREVLEDELIPLFEKCGTIWDLRLMMDPLTGQSRGFCFVTFTEKRAAEDAVKQLDGYAIKGNKHLKVNISTPNCRLFVGNIPKSRSKEEIIQEFSKVTEGLTDVIIYAVPDDPKKKNRGFAFLDYDSHKSASAAKRRLGGGHIKVFNCDIIVDWADPLAEPDEETMSKVKVLYVRNLKADITEEQLREKFEEYGKLEKVKKVRDYGFIHFYEREDAVRALEELNGTKISDSELLITLAKPPIDAKTKEKRKIQHMMMLGRPDPYFGGGIGMAPGRLLPGISRVRIPRPPMSAHAAFRAPVAYDLDYYGGYDAYYDPYAEDYDYYGYTGYEDYAGYEDYDYYVPVASYPAPAMPRARGRGVGLSGMAGRGLGLRPPRGVPGLASAGRGTRILRGAMRAPYGRGIEAAGGRGAMAPRGVKRKAATDFSVAETKKPHTQDAWGAQPIAQQPLSQTATTYSESEWYQDSYSTLDGQEWG